MKAARLTSPKTFEFMEVETPTPADGQCLIKLESVSVCGSDIRSTYGPTHPEEEYPMAPGRPCHEVAGVVVESRTDAFKVGQRVMRATTISPTLGENPRVSKIFIIVPPSNDTVGRPLSSLKAPTTVSRARVITSVMFPERRPSAVFDNTCAFTRSPSMARRRLAP